MKAKVTKLPAADKALLGQSVSGLNASVGDVGRHVEDLLDDAHYEVDREGILDMPGLGIEVKSRIISSTTAHTVGSMTVENILKTPYEDSPIFQKTQRQLRVKHDGNTIVESKVYDFSGTYEQTKISAAYEHGRRLMAEGKFDQLGKGPDTRWGYWEKCTNGSSYKFRVRDKAMRGLEDMQTSTFKKLFDVQ